MPANSVDPDNPPRISVVCDCRKMFVANSMSETRTFANKIDALPTQTEAVQADSGYDANILGERVAYDAQGRRTSRKFLCPENPRNYGNTKTKPGGADAARAYSRKLRAKRKRYYESRICRRKYRRCSKTVEPFNSWLKALFELDLNVWQRGLPNNQTQLLTSIFAYQLLVWYNHRRGRKNARLRSIFDTL